MRKWPGRIIPIVLCALILGIGLSDQLMKPVDDVVLLEKWAPLYWNKMAMNKRQPVYRAEGEGTAYNYVVNELQKIQGNGFTLQANSDGSITFSGKNEGKKRAYYSFCIGDETFLPDGEYLYTDGGVSGNSGIFTCVEGINYAIGGKTYFPDLAFPSSEQPEVFFTADHTLYSEYKCTVAIDPGYESEETTFYPMIRSASESDARYSPCWVRYPGDIREELQKAECTRLDPGNVGLLTERDWELLKNSLTSDVCGNRMDLLLLPGHMGILRDGGQLILVDLLSSGSKTDMKDALPSYRQSVIGKESKSLSEQRDFFSYLQELMGKNYSIFFSIREEGTRELVGPALEQLRRLGLTTDFADKYRYSYLAVIDQGTMKEEKVGKEVLESDGNLSCGLTYTVKSGGYESGWIGASLVLDGKEYAMNHRGLNILVYDDAVGKVLDTVAFDTCSGLVCYRPAGEIQGIPVEERQ